MSHQHKRIVGDSRGRRSRGRSSLRLVVIVVGLLVGLSNLLGAQEHKTALLIANGRYTTLGNLEQPVPEARQLAVALRSIGFVVTILENASREDMADAIIDFQRALNQRGGTGFFHYGGHAVQVDNANFLIPANANIPDEDRVASRAIDLSEVTRAIESSRATTSVIIVDACRDNPLPRQSGRSAARGLSVAGVAPPGTIVVYSAQAGAVARDGVFTPALIRNLTRPLSFNEILQQVAQEVSQATAGAQRPFSYADLTMPTIYLAGRPGAAAAAVTPAPAIASAPPVTTAPVATAIAPTRPAFQVDQGSLRVSVAAAATILVDGVEVGALAAGQSATLSGIEVGQRSVVARYANGQNETQTVSVAANQTATASFSYTEPVGPRVGETWTSPNGFRMVGVPAGSFNNGTSQVTLSGFWMMQTEVTQGLYQTVMGSNPSATDRGIGTNNPVNRVSWYDALVFANRLSMREGLTPVYTISGSTDPSRWGAVPTDSNNTWNAVVMNRSANGYRLPTEAEWEWAARGATASRNTTYAGSNSANDVAWHYGNSNNRTQPVASKAANELGLHDMSGNVWEWVWDWHGSYPSTAQSDPVGPSSGTNRVLRGGGWFFTEDLARVAIRDLIGPRTRSNGNGFRLVRAWVR